MIVDPIIAYAPLETLDLFFPLFSKINPAEENNRNGFS